MKGLIFNESMMKAWLEGRKTVTRRLMKPQPLGESPYPYWPANKYGGDFVRPEHAPYRPGETVYIKETWMGTKDCLSYKASDPRQIIEFNYDRWQSPPCMPEWAARSHALIVSVRPERVQEITEEEAVKEGIGAGFQMNSGWPDYQHIENGICTLTQDNAVASFVSLWESLYPGSWERNDWVWRIELKKQEGE